MSAVAARLQADSRSTVTVDSSTLGQLLAAVADNYKIATKSIEWETAVALADSIKP